MKICSSKFNARCTIRKKTSADDGAGGQTITYSDRGKMFAMVDERIASEPLDRERLETQRRVAFFTAYRSDIVVTDRIVLDTIVHNVTSLTRVGQDGRPAYRGKFLRIDTDSSDWYSA